MNWDFPFWLQSASGLSHCIILFIKEPLRHALWINATSIDRWWRQFKITICFYSTAQVFRVLFSKDRHSTYNNNKLMMVPWAAAVQHNRHHVVVVEAGAIFKYLQA